MGKKKERISVNAFEAAAGIPKDDTVTVEWNGLDILVKKHLSFQEMMAFVNYIADLSFEAETGKYLPEVTDFATRCAVIEQYTNLTLPKNINKQYDLLYKSDVYTAVLSPILEDSTSESQYNGMVADAYTKVRHRAQANIEAVTQQMNSVTAEIEGIASQMTKLFDGVDNKTINDIAGAIANGAFDEEKLAKAVLENYTPSDNIVPLMSGA